MGGKARPKVNFACSIPGCSRPAARFRLCWPHHYRRYRYGDPLAGSTFVGEPSAFIEKALAYDGNDCLIWPFKRSKNGGYPQYWDGERETTASRIVCAKVNGPPPGDNYHAAHSCGNGHGGCVTKRHLRWATPSENSEDSRRHGTMRLGRHVHTAKLTEMDILEIRRAYPSVRIARLAARYAVSWSTIHCVITRKTWGHIGYNPNDT